MKIGKQPSDSNPQMGQIVITGMGIVSPIGETPDDYRDALKAGRSGITKWKEPYGDSYSQIGGDMSGFDLKAHLAQFGTAYPADLVKLARKLLRATPQSGQMTAAAALQAYVDSCLTEGGIQPERCAHILAGHNLTHPTFTRIASLFRANPNISTRSMASCIWIQIYSP